MDRLRCHRPALVASVLTIAVAFAFSFLWTPVVDHGSGWIQGGDLWDSLRAAHFVAWGDYGYIYSATFFENGIPGTVSFPGFYIVLAPIAMLVSHFHLGEGAPAAIPHPTAYPLLLGYSLLLSCLALFAFDALLVRLRVSPRRRWIGDLGAAAALWEVTAVWGHPEYTIGLGFALYGLIAALDGKWSKAGWLFGFAIAFQPLMGLPLLVVLGLAGPRRWLPTGLRAAALPVFLIVWPLIHDWHNASYQLFGQPTYPVAKYWLTPWLDLVHPRFALIRPKEPALAAQVLRSMHCARSAHPRSVLCKFANIQATALMHKVGYYYVKASTVRLGAVAGSALLGIWAWRRTPSAYGMVWLFAGALALRIVFEPVMFPYYVGPTAAMLALLAVLAPRRLKVAACLVAGAGLFEYSWRHGPEWRWWLVLVGIVIAALAVAFPYRGFAESRLAEAGAEVDAEADMATGPESIPGEEGGGDRGSGTAEGISVPAADHGVGKEHPAAGVGLDRDT